MPAYGRWLNRAPRRFGAVANVRRRSLAAVDGSRTALTDALLIHQCGEAGNVYKQGIAPLREGEALLLEVGQFARHGDAVGADHVGEVLVGGGVGNQRLPAAR